MRFRWLLKHTLLYRQYRPTLLAHESIWGSRWPARSWWFPKRCFEEMEPIDDPCLGRLEDFFGLQKSRGTWILGRCTCLETPMCTGKSNRKWMDLWLLWPVIFPWMLIHNFQCVICLGGGWASTIEIEAKKQCISQRLEEKSCHNVRCHQRMMMMRLSGYPRSQDMIREKLLKVPRHKAVCVWEKRKLTWHMQIESCWQLLIYIYIYYTYGPQNRWVVHVIAMLHVWKSSQQW